MLVCVRRPLAPLLSALAFLTLSPESFAQNAGQDKADAGVEVSPEAASASDTSEVPVSEDELATARLHFANGVELLQTEPPNYQDAYRQFILALEKSGRSWKVLGNLAFCALKLERDGEALAYYDEYLRRGGDKIDPREKTSIERETLLARGNLATVSIESSEPEARISVVRQGSSAPVQLYHLKDGKAELGLRSGTLTITAKLGDKSLVWSPVLAAGESGSHVFDFDAQPPSAAPVPAPAPSQAPAEVDTGKKMSPLRLTGFITAGVGVAALGGGVITGMLSQNQEKSAQDSCIEDTCPEATESDFDSAASMATVANVLFIAGGVLTAAGVTLVIVGGNKSKESAIRSMSPAPKLALAPLVAPSGGGLFAQGTF